jgi:peptidyl-tRNA hydrolase, PTH2 family
MDEVVQYYIVNKELKMSKGKTSAQVAHGAVISAMVWGEFDFYKEWFLDSQKKVVLQGTIEDIEKIQMNMESYRVIDNGLTEIPEGSVTVLVLPPMQRSVARQYVERLQLLKD